MDAETIISTSPHLILSSHIYSFIISPAELSGRLIKLGCGTNFYTEKNVSVFKKKTTNNACLSEFIHKDKELAPPKAAPGSCCVRDKSKSLIF